MKVFVDTSVLLAASASKTGGSALVLRLGSVGRVKLVTSEAVVEEAIRNAEKLHVTTIVIEHLVLSSNIRVDPPPAFALVEKYEAIVSEKDAHVIAAAMAAKTKVLITLDRKLKEQGERSIKIIQILTPEELLKELTKLV